MDKFSLRVNAFDLDFNVVNTRHKIIHLDEKIGDKRYPISVRLDAFEQQWYKENLGKNYRFRNDDIYQAFIEQSDEWVHGELGLLDDLRQNDHWPSMQKLLQSVCEADPSSIVTARQASEKALQKSLYEWFSEKLTDDQKKLMQEIATYKYTRAIKWTDILKQYTERINCYAMYNKALSKAFWFEVGWSGNTPERKSIVILHDIHRFNNNEMWIRKELWDNMNSPKEYGFSDDEHGNITHVANRIMSEKAIWSLRDRKITLFHTDKKFPSKISIKNHEDQKQTYKSD